MRWCCVSGKALFSVMGKAEDAGVLQMPLEPQLRQKPSTKAVVLHLSAPHECTKDDLLLDLSLML